MLSLMSSNRKSVALITNEVEYIFDSMVSYEVVWLRKLFGEIFEQILDTTMIYCEDKNIIYLEENLIFQDKSKHINIWYHYI